MNYNGGDSEDSGNWERWLRRAGKNIAVFFRHFRSTLFRVRRLVCVFYG